MNARKGDTWDSERDGVRLLSEMCDTCIFRPGNLMQIRPGRLRDIVSYSRCRESYVVCHKTLREVTSRGEALCRGFYDLPKPTAFIQVGNRLKWWRLVRPSDYKESA